MTLNWQFVDSQLIFDQCIWVGQHSASYEPTVYQVSIECQPSVNWEVGQAPIKMLIEGIDQHLTVVSTHDLISQNCNRIVKSIQPQQKSPSTSWCQPAGLFILIFRKRWQNQPPLPTIEPPNFVTNAVAAQMILCEQKQSNKQNRLVLQPKRKMRSFMLVQWKRDCKKQ